MPIAPSGMPAFSILNGPLGDWTGPSSSVGCDTIAVMVVSSRLKPAGSVMLAAMRVCDRASGSIAQSAPRIGFGTLSRHQTISSRWVTFGKKSGSPTMQ